MHILTKKGCFLGCFHVILAFLEVKIVQIRVKMMSKQCILCEIPVEKGGVLRQNDLFW